MVVTEGKCTPHELWKVALYIVCDFMPFCAFFPRAFAEWTLLWNVKLAGSVSRDYKHSGTEVWCVAAELVMIFSFCLCIYLSISISIFLFLSIILIIFHSCQDLKKMTNKYLKFLSVFLYLHGTAFFSLYFFLCMNWGTLSILLPQ